MIVITMREKKDMLFLPEKTTSAQRVNTVLEVMIKSLLIKMT